MTQTRIVLNPKYKDKAQEILEATGIDSLSQLFTLLLANYGDVLVKALKQYPQVAPVAPQPPVSAAQAPAIKPESSLKPKQQFTPLSSF